MDDRTLRKIQLTELEIAKELKKICEKNDIQYFMEGGSLLGAIRHKGFIPWDDDIDFGMLREEYEKFIRIAPEELDDRYYLQVWPDDRDYPFEFAKIRKKGTLYLEASSNRRSDHNEIWIDIFPYDEYPEGLNRLIHKCQVGKYNRMLLMKCGIKAWANHPSKVVKILVFLKYLPAKVLSLFFTKEQIHKKLHKWLCVKKNDRLKYYHVGTGPCPYGTTKVSKSNFSGFAETVFENTTFPAPVGYDKYLTEVYGDYMTPPPPEKRTGNHNVVEIKV